MNSLVFGGVCGLLLGMAVQAAGLTRTRAVRDALSWRRTPLLKLALAFAGYGALLTALLGYLAVLDVDLLPVPALDWATLAGGVLTGLGLALTGLTPGTALAAIGGGAAREGLCAMAGCLLGALALPYAADWLAPLRASAWTNATLFRVTLDEPYLLPGGFLGLGVLGLALLILAAWVPSSQAREAEAVRAAEEPAAPEPEEPALNEDEILAMEEIPDEEPEEVDGEPDAPVMTDHPELEEAPAMDAGEPDEPVMTDHPELEEAPEADEDFTEALVEKEEQAGIGSYLSEEALPVNARVLVKPDAEELGLTEKQKPEKEREPVGKA